MGFAEMVVGIVFIASVSETIKAIAKRGGGKEAKLVLNEVRALREEVQQLKRQQNDLILALDGSLDQLNRHLGLPEGNLEAAARSSTSLEVRSGPL